MCRQIANFYHTILEHPFEHLRKYKMGSNLENAISLIFESKQPTTTIYYTMANMSNVNSVTKSMPAFDGKSDPTKFLDVWQCYFEKNNVALDRRLEKIRPYMVPRSSADTWLENQLSMEVFQVHEWNEFLHLFQDRFEDNNPMTTELVMFPTESVHDFFDRCVQTQRQEESLIPFDLGVKIKFLDGLPSSLLHGMAFSKNASSTDVLEMAKKNVPAFVKANSKKAKLNNGKKAGKKCCDRKKRSPSVEEDFPASSENRPSVTFNFAKGPMTFLIDTGAQDCLVHLRHVISDYSIQPTNIKATGANGQFISLVGTVTLPFVIGGEVLEYKALVCDDPMPPSDLLVNVIGSDFLKRTEAQINYFLNGRIEVIFKRKFNTTEIKKEDQGHNSSELSDVEGTNGDDVNTVWQLAGPSTSRATSAPQPSAPPLEKMGTRSQAPRLYPMLEENQPSTSRQVVLAQNKKGKKPLTSELTFVRNGMLYAGQESKMKLKITNFNTFGTLILPDIAKKSYVIRGGEYKVSHWSNCFYANVINVSDQMIFVQQDEYITCMNFDKRKK